MILKNVVDYLEKELFGEIDYDEIARAVHYGKDSVARIFAASTGFTLAGYVRVRRLSEAGKLLAGGAASVAGLAYDCGYSAPESFTKAFGKFHGFSPTECRDSGKYRYVPAWICADEKQRLTYEIKRFDGMRLVGFGGRIDGKIDERFDRDEAFCLSTRREQDALRLLRREDDVDWWEVLRDFDADGYDYRIAVVPEKNKIDVTAMKTRLKNGEEYEVGENEIEPIASKFERIEVGGKYAVFASVCRDFPMRMLDDFTRAVYAGIDDYGFVRDDKRPDLLRIRWHKRARISERRLELCLPIN